VCRYDWGQFKVLLDEFFPAAADESGAGQALPALVNTYRMELLDVWAKCQGGDNDKVLEEVGAVQVECSFTRSLKPPGFNP
jgi:hypothetical protein